MSIFEQTRKMADEKPLIKYTVMGLFVGGSVYLIGWLNSFTGVLFAIGAWHIILLTCSFSDRTTYLLGLIPCIIAAILAYAVEWKVSPFDGHFHFAMAFSILVWWAIKYRKAMSNHTPSE